MSENPENLVDVTMLDEATEKIVTALNGAQTALQDAQETLVEEQKILSGEIAEHIADPNAHGLATRANIGAMLPRPKWDGTSLIFESDDGSFHLDGVDLKGETGARGVKGDDGAQGPMPDHTWEGTRLIWKNPDGSWDYPGVDLKGDTGDDATVELSDEIDRDCPHMALNLTGAKKLNDKIKDALNFDNLGNNTISISKVDLTKLTKQQKTILSKAIAADLIHPKGGLGVHPDDSLLFVDFESMSPEIMKKVVLGMIADEGGIGVDENGKLRVDLNSLGDDMRKSIMNALGLPVPLGQSRTFHVNRSHASAGNVQPLPKRSAYPATSAGYEQYAAALEQISNNNDRRGNADFPFDTIQHALDHVCGSFNMGSSTATIQIASGVYREKVTLPAFSATTGHVTLAGTGTVTFNEDGTITDTRETVFSGSMSDAGGGNYYFNNLKFQPDTSGESVAATRIWTGDSIYPLRIASKATTAYVMKCDFTGAHTSGGKPWNCLWVSGGNLTISSDCIFRGSWTNLWYGQGGANITLSRDVLLSGVQAAIIMALDNAMFFRAGPTGGALAKINTSGTVTGKRYQAALLSVISLRGADPDVFFPGDAAGALLSGSVKSEVVKN